METGACGVIGGRSMDLVGYLPRLNQKVCHGGVHLLGVRLFPESADCPPLKALRGSKQFTLNSGKPSQVVFM